ncbi:MAG TPA: hypothetical protein PK440_14030 [Candidatus Accumulibacter phosphatis]|nr:MAG: hypothetical protein AW07_01175 [Candidatus Accumulibacter sp. SK-11]HAY28558.1 hypothetical protein [Accumulibacter sp.]HRL77602.1 hypothetical protein [Candidatus Accumulibacter phosphatis]HRQ96097.1 hypothetical protein [Candidatus Accumulibacter phosphatis]
MRRLLAPSLAAALLLASGIGRADVPTLEDECRLRNAAVCELNGVEYRLDAPCPATARTLRPLGSERCRGAAQVGSEHLELPSTAAARTPPAATSPAQHLAWLGRNERWLLPLLLLVGALLLAAVAVFVLRQRPARRERPAAEAGTGSQLLQILLAAVLAVPLGHQAAGLALRRVLANFDNRDSAAPWLLAAPVGLLVFLLVSGISFALLVLLFGYLVRRPRRQQGGGSPAGKDDPPGGSGASAGARHRERTGAD